jgi:hypothetical protein
MADKMTRFLKELVSRPLRTSKGWPVQFTPIGDDTGILETNDPHLIRELRDMILAQRGGVREITSDEEWEETKKKASEREQYRQRVKSPWSDPVRLENPTRKAASPAIASAPVPDPSLPTPPPIGKAIEVPAEIKPTGRRGRRPKAVTGDGKPVEEPSASGDTEAP